MFVALGHGACASETGDERGPAESIGEVALELGATSTVGTITPGDFAVSYDANSAYFTYFAGEFCFGGLEIEKMSLSTGTKTILRTGGCSSPAQSASDGTNLFYAGLQARDILSKDVAGTSPPAVVMADAPNILSGGGIEVDASRVYWADHSLIRSMPKAGGGVTTHFTGPNLTVVLGVDATDIYFESFVSSPCCSNELRKVPIAGGSSTLLHTQNFQHGSFAMADGNLYWATNENGDSSIQRMPSTGGAPATIYSKPSNCVISLAANSSNVYWSENTSCNLVSGGARLRRRTNPTGAGIVTTERTGLQGPYALFLSATDLFWIDGSSSSKAVRRASLTSPPNSCDGSCGGQAPGGCFCDDLCTGYGDCCSDFTEQCTSPNSCDGQCGGQAPGGCFCDDLCTGYGDCCPDFASACP